jgi:hypothetical protein
MLGPFWASEYVVGVLVCGPAQVPLTSLQFVTDPFAMGGAVISGGAVVILGGVGVPAEVPVRTVKFWVLSELKLENC